jgi:hypothetical protein
MRGLYSIRRQIVGPLDLVGGRALRARVADRVQEFLDSSGGRLRRDAQRRILAGDVEGAVTRVGRRDSASSHAPRIREWRRLPATRKSPTRVASGSLAIPLSSASRSLLPGRILRVAGSFRRLARGRDSESGGPPFVHLFRRSVERRLRAAVTEEAHIRRH